MTKQKEILKGLSLEKLIETFERVDKMEESVHVRNVRRWVLDELLLRDIEAFDKWTDEEMEQGIHLSPRNYYIRKEVA